MSNQPGTITTTARSCPDSATIIIDSTPCDILATEQFHDETGRDTIVFDIEPTDGGDATAVKFNGSDLVTVTAESWVTDGPEWNGTKAVWTIRTMDGATPMEIEVASRRAATDTKEDPPRIGGQIIIREGRGRSGPRLTRSTDFDVFARSVSDAIADPATASQVVADLAQAVRP